MGLFLRENHLSKCWGCLSLLNWIGTLTLSLLLKLSPGVLTHSMKLLSPKVPLYLYKSTMLPCMKYCCHVWDGAPSCYKNTYVGLFVHHHHLLLLLNPLAPHQNAESLSYRYYVGSFPCTDKLLNSLPIECFPLTYDQSDFQSRINHGTITGTGITCKEILL